MVGLFYEAVQGNGAPVQALRHGTAVWLRVSSGGAFLYGPGQPAQPMVAEVVPTSDRRSKSGFPSLEPGDKAPEQ